MIDIDRWKLLEKYNRYLYYSNTSQKSIDEKRIKCTFFYGRTTVPLKNKTFQNTYAYTIGWCINTCLNALRVRVVIHVST